ncbi:SMP-30/gluconolactonase/LRE family protein [Novosphingobium sp. JCM 18896]|uniref:SMP-30/gluconolactonase/LRE family protein n=1 Tax=Novosphingobium sp. JCM 18896 TaxID=2989731 RepID=UPI002221CFB3|nr:SMP-30/gluconolactonase/LRE family protein [Novosphingobium sp. JCM 18896]MCW1429786.1 SMP-30/gluconolactonase/LRE family protein [Novosphingobium sp. JCM 18896]
MYPIPPSVEAEVFAVIPEALSYGTRKSDWASVQVHGNATPTFLEGPCFDAAGDLWVTDIPWGRVFKIAQDGTVSVGAEYDGYPNGLKFLADGTALIADLKNGIMKFDPAKGTVEPYLTRRLLEPFRGCNDLCVAKNGDVYFTDQAQSSLADAYGRVYCLRAATGKLDLVLDKIPSPNGLVLNKSENALYLAVTRANQIWKINFNADGSTGKVGIFIQLSGGHGPDGITIDEDDGLAVCHVGMGSVWLFDAYGEPTLRIKSPKGRMTTNLAYGGPGNRTIYFTESATGTVLKAEVPVAGRKLL